MKLAGIILSSSLIASAIACNNPAEQNDETATAKSGIVQTDWGETDSTKVYLFTLTNSKGTEVKITNYGGIVTSFVTADKAGSKSSIVIGFDSLSSYLQKPPYFGALIGRYGNRIGNAKFTLEGKEYKLAANDGKNALHGGVKGFDKVVWAPTVINDTVPELMLTYLSKDGEDYR